MSKQIIVGICGSIAAYKSAYLVRLLKSQGHAVQVVMTESAKHFIGTTTLQALSERSVRCTLWDSAAEAAMSHIELARWADDIIIAPASANVMARLVQGMADDLLTTLCLATTAPLYLAPAMNQNMWHHTATQQNVSVLKQRGVTIIEPDAGEQACGEIGLGRMAEPDAIVEYWSVPRCLAAKRVLITAGPTQEALDPVRYLSNHSSGKMGYALAAAAHAAGAEVTLISGPVALEVPPGIKRVSVVSAHEMLVAVMAHIADQDIFIATAAVADFCCENISAQKQTKKEIPLSLNLKLNPDVLGTVTQDYSNVFSVGFCAQTHDVLQYAHQKLKNKQCDLMVANDVSQANIGFSSEYNALTVLWSGGQIQWQRASKVELAKQLVALIAERLAATKQPLCVQEEN